MCALWFWGSNVFKDQDLDNTESFLLCHLFCQYHEHYSDLDFTGTISFGKLNTNALSHHSYRWDVLWNSDDRDSLKFVLYWHLCKTWHVRFTLRVQELSLMLGGGRWWCYIVGASVLTYFVCSSQVSKSLWVGCSGFRSPVCKVHVINEWNSWGRSPPSQSFCEGLVEVGNGSQVILSLSLTHCRPHPDRLVMPYWDVFFFFFLFTLN